MVLLFAIPTYVCCQINSFPAAESFESVFTTGTDVAFISNWQGNDVRTTSRIFKGTDDRTTPGNGSLNIIPTSTFSGEVLISLDFTGISNPKISFYAYSKQNGSGSSTRPVLLNYSTSIDGGSNFTMLNYQFHDPGNTVTIKIINASGDVVRTVVQNALVGKQGFFTWDGTLSNGGKARVGYYMVLMEVITTSGEVNFIKDRVAIGSRF